MKEIVLVLLGIFGVSAFIISILRIKHRHNKAKSEALASISYVLIAVFFGLSAVNKIFFPRPIHYGNKNNIQQTNGLNNKEAEEFKLLYITNSTDACVKTNLIGTQNMSVSDRYNMCKCIFNGVASQMSVEELVSYKNGDSKTVQKANNLLIKYEVQCGAEFEN
ncbi:MAG: hypothetical protein K5912_02785 [Alphaproteobacteria bacterium]|nr:hypothetical protein [Alphaproteobacteria bacterium]